MMSTADDLVYRRAQSDDLPSLLALLPQIARDPDADLARMPSLARAEEIFAEMARRGDTVIFVAATADDRLLGTCTLAIAPSLGHGGRPAATIEMVVVATAHRGRGIGTRLLAHATAYARAAGCYKAQLITGGRPEQIAFYRKAGFSWQGVGFKTHFPS